VLQEGRETLKKSVLCPFGGSAMPTELGDRLVEAGVRLAGHYGASPRRLLLLFPFSSFLLC
jgi:hypothetical protein